MKYFSFIICILVFVFQFLFSNIHYVPEDYSTIQSAIDNSSYDGDTILVSPGTYIENIDYNSKNIFLTSYYFFTEDNSSIHNTIIDGNQNGSVVTFYGGETRDAVLNGFTIINGSGRYIGGVITHGGGLYIRDSSPSILNCLITKNFVYGVGNGGGIYIKNSNVFLSNITVTENYSESQDAGGIYFNNSNAIMDSVNRCSVFLNEAGDHNDIRCNFESDLCPAIYLDTASVGLLDDYFIAGDFEVVDILNGKLEKVADNLYVSPYGDNNNSGITPDEPLKNITYALHIIDADSLNPRVIHLLPGTYSPSGGQIFPLNLRSYVSIIGSGKENTIIDLEQDNSICMIGGNYEKNITLSSFTIKNGSTNYASGQVLIFYHNANLIIESILFENIHSYSIVIPTATTSYMEYPDYTSTTLRNCEFRNNTVSKAASLGSNTDILVQNCTFGSNFPVEYPEDDWLDGSHKSISIGGHHYSYQFSYTRRIENCVFTRNENAHSGEIGVKAVSLLIKELDYPIDIVNCTFADNSSELTSIQILSTHLIHTEARFVNCILWNNDIPYEISVPEDYYEGEEMVNLNMAYNNVQNGTDKFLFEGSVDLSFEDSNIDIEPLFLDPENGDYSLHPNSPMIDVGTALYIIDGDTVLNISSDQYYGDAPDMGAYEFYPNLENINDLLLFPESASIISVFPNPFNPITAISYEIGEKTHVDISVINLNGQIFEVLVNDVQQVGAYSIDWNATGKPTGIYFIRMKTAFYSTTQKIILLK